MIHTLPPVPERRLAIRLRPDALRQVRGGHPWVYAEAIDSVSNPGAVPGTLGVVFDRNRRFVAIGLWDPNSPIRLRILHVGNPMAIDASFWIERVASAKARRSALEKTGTTGYRLLHGENDGTGGLVVDVYGRTAVVKLYSSAWIPHLVELVAAIVSVGGLERVVVRLGRLVGRLPARELFGLADGVVLQGPEPAGPIEFRENHLIFEADVIRGQKTGHFFDQRDNRAHVRDLSAGASVLDVFCCTGGFSVYAAAGGAVRVHSVDLSKHAISAVERNMARNADLTRATMHLTTVGDAFEVMHQLGSRRELHDIVVVDPPSFASRASERDGAIRAYRKLTELALPLVRPGGRLVQASCSSRVSESDLINTIRAALRGQGRSTTDELVLGHALDHPIGFPQGAYLKAFSAVVR